MLDKTRNDLESLKARRSALNGTVVRLQGERNRLQGAEDVERDARGALDALGREEVAAIRKWASTAVAGPAPQGDPARRAALTRDLVVAEAASAAARGAGAGVDRELADASLEAAGLAQQIERAAIVELIELFNGDWAEVQVRAAELRAGIAKLMAISVALFERADQHEDRGRADAAMRIRRAVQPLLGAVKIDVGPTVAEVAGFVSAWAEHFAGLTR